MSAGTITLTNNSATVNGSGTTFTDLESGDFIVATVGGVTYTLAVSTVDSATKVTLVANYTGPTQGGLAWNGVPRATQNQVTAELVAQATAALRGLNYDKQNWQQVFTGTGNVTMTLPDGSTYTGPAWSSITTALNGKANSSDVLTKADNLASVANKATARTNLGLGGAAVLNVGSTAGTVAAGNDSRLNTIAGKTGGVLQDDSSITQVSSDMSGATTGQIATSAPFRSILRGRGAGSGEVGAVASFYAVEVVGSYAGAAINLYGYQGSRTWTFRIDNNAYAPGSWVNLGSDIRIKKNFKEIENPRQKLRAIRAGTWNYAHEGSNGRFGIGVIANDLGELYPQAVFNTGSRTLEDGSVVDNVLSVEAGDSGVAVAVHHANLLQLCDEVEELQQENNLMRNELDELKAQVEKLTSQAA